MGIGNSFSLWAVWIHQIPMDKGKMTAALCHLYDGIGEEIFRDLGRRFCWCNCKRAAPLTRFTASKESICNFCRARNWALDFEHWCNWARLIRNFERYHLFLASKISRFVVHIRQLIYAWDGFPIGWSGAGWVCPDCIAREVCWIWNLLKDPEADFIRIQKPAFERKPRGWAHGCWVNESEKKKAKQKHPLAYLCNNFLTSWFKVSWAHGLDYW